MIRMNLFVHCRSLSIKNPHNNNYLLTYTIESSDSSNISDISDSRDSRHNTDSSDNINSNEIN